VVKNTEKDEIRNWLCEVMPLYRQAESVTANIYQIDSDGLPIDLKSLAVILDILPPILVKIKKMPKPGYNKLRQLQKDFRLLLDACIKSARYTLKIEKKHSRLGFSAAVFWTNLAVSFKKTLSPKMEKLARDFDKGGLL
jgi:hypothetical protein